MSSDSTPGVAPWPGRYFFLSYAHSPPLAGSLRDLDSGGPQDPDLWVSTFFRDLSTAVRGAAKHSRLASGFFDQDVPPGADWKVAVTQALGVAQVFVPLYSPGYFARSLPGREWNCFHARMVAAELDDPLQRFVPLLWIPVSGDQSHPGLPEARAIGATESAYGENGLRALLRLQPYHASYQRIVTRVAARIVNLAEDSPIPASSITDIDEAPSAFTAEAATAVFAVTVAAPDLKTLPAGRDPAGYGERSESWRPFHHDQEIPVATYAARVAEQLDFAVLVGGLEKSGEVPSSRPGVVLIDPCFIAGKERLERLRAFAEDLRFISWVLPLVILEPGADARTADLATQVAAILDEAGLARTGTSRRAIAGVRTLAEFVMLMPLLVVEAERQYLRHGQGPRARASLAPQPRLAGGHGPASPGPPKKSRREADA